ncbi:translation initiation factor [Capnocytophaga canimorsus]|uniref:translation initiation factor n=1 Tax=Capnocytophaga canimorsus TaxID=28188 RepID=UPI0037D229C1
MKDLREQLKNLFPDHVEQEEVTIEQPNIWMQDEPLHCKYEKRKGKPVTIIEGYQGADTDFKILAREIKTFLGVGGAFKDESIIIQGDYREKIMQFLKEKGFKVKRVGG